MIIDFNKYINNSEIKLTEKIISEFNSSEILVELILFLKNNKIINNINLSECNISYKEVLPLKNYDLFLPNITTLNLFNNKGIGKQEINILIIIFSKLQNLDISYTSIMGEDLFYFLLTKNNFLEYLVSLKLDGLELSDAEVVFCEDYPYFTKVEKLSLTDNTILDNKLELILDFIKHFPNLTSLDLSNNYITNEGTEFIMEAKTLQTLIDVNLSGNNLAFNGLAVIINEFNYKNLVSLKLYQNLLKTNDAYLLANCKFESLNYLDLRDNCISDEGIALISEAKWLNKITTLLLDANALSTSALIYLLVDYKSLKLQKLHLSNNQIDDEGIEFLSKNYPKTLNELNLNFNLIGKKSLIALKKIIASDNLIKLDLAGNYIDSNCVNELAYLVKGNLQILNIKSNNLGINTILSLLNQINLIDNLKLTSLNITNTLKVINKPEESLMINQNNSGFSNCRNEANDYSVYHPDMIKLIAQANVANTTNLEIIFDNIYQPFLQLLVHIYNKMYNYQSFDEEKIKILVGEIRNFPKNEIVINYLHQLIDDKEIPSNINYNCYIKNLFFDNEVLLKTIIDSTECNGLIKLELE